MRIRIDDVNDKVPQFEGLDPQGRYSSAVSDQTIAGSYVLNVVAFDLDGTEPNNVVSDDVILALNTGKR